MKVRITQVPKFAQGGTVSPEKAKLILEEGTANKKPLTKKQKSYFGWLASKARNGLTMQPTTQQGLTVEDGKYKTLSPDSIELTGDRHKDGGQKIEFGGNQIEAEGTEVVQQTPTEDGVDMVVMGNMEVPGTGKTFKDVAKDLNEKEGKAREYEQNGTDIVLDTDPENSQWDQLKFNSGRAMMEGGHRKVQELQETKQTLADTQQALLDIAHENGLDPQKLSKGEVELGSETPEKMPNGGKLSMAQRNNNPGNLKYLPWMKAYGAVKTTDKTENDGTFYAKFPTLEQGQAAMKHLLFEKYNPNTTVANAINTWTNNQPYDSSLTAGISDKKLGDLTPEQQGQLLNAITQGEDSMKYNWTDVDGNPIERPQTVQETQPQVPVDYSEIPDVPAPPTIETPKEPTATPIAPTPTIPDFKQFISSRRATPPSNAEALNPIQLIPELYGLRHNQQEAVFQQSYQPELFEPFRVSFQDRINENNRQLNALRQSSYFANNPEALSTLAGQTYNANNQVLADEFRTNQQIANEVTNKNVGLLNEAQATNLKLQDQAFVRQTAANAKTQETNQLLINSIINKVLQNSLENRQIRAIEATTDYRFNPQGQLQNYSGVNPVDELSWGSNLPKLTGKQTVKEVYGPNNQLKTKTITKK